MAKIAVLGFGTVGSGVVEICSSNASLLTSRVGEPMDVKYILDRFVPEGTPYTELFTSKIDEIVNDPEVTVVAEAIGGVEPVFTFLSASLKAGKHVVTANKQLVAEKGAELLALAKEHGVKFLFEASVGGGIPIIRPLQNCLVANNIQSMAGVLNGTSNFILTKMKEESWSFEQALKEAQALGYAEADPSADVDGLDTCRKICILASLAYGEHVYPEHIHVEGIRGVSPEEIAIADHAGYSIKLVGKAAMVDDLLQVIVAPMMIPKKEMLGNISGVFNGVSIVGDMVGEVFLYGPGAGKLPTASAMVADIAECIQRGDTPPIIWANSTENNVENHLLIKTSQMVRYQGSRDNIEMIFGETIFISHPGRPEESAFLTPYYLTEIQINEKLRLLEVEGGKVISTIRVLGDLDRWHI